MFADVSFSTEALVVIGTLVTALAGTVGVLFRLLIASKDQQMKDSESSRESYKEMANEAITNLEKAARDKADAEGKPKPLMIAAVIPEHNSPTTKKQQEAAALQTIRARLVAATLQLGLPPRMPAPLEQGEGT